MKWRLNRSLRGQTKPSEVTIENFDQYQIYGFFRNPLDRFLSLVRYAQQEFTKFEKFNTDAGMSADEIKLLTYDQFFDNFSKFNSFVPFYFDPQVEWIANANLLDFNNYNAEILRVARLLDITQVEIAKHNWTENSEEQPLQKVIDFVQSYYADDYRLGRERGLLA